MRYYTNSLRQGNPPTPYLFILTMEALSRLLMKVRKGDLITGFKVGGRGLEGVKLTHLLYVDNTIILCDASQEHLVFLN